MTNRVFLGNFNGPLDYRLRVSVPGADVLDPALPGNLVAFDSEWFDAANILMSGSFVWGSNSFVDVLFGETFAPENLPIPMFWPMAVDQNGIDVWVPSGYMDGQYTGVNSRPGIGQLMTDRVRYNAPGSNLSLRATGGVYIILRRRVGL